MVSLKAFWQAVNVPVQPERYAGRDLPDDRRRWRVSRRGRVASATRRQEMTPGPQAAGQRADIA